MDSPASQVQEWIDSKNYRSLLSFALEENPVDLSDFLNTLKVADFLTLFRLLPKDKASEVYSYLSLEDRETLMDKLSEGELSAVLERLQFDDLIDALEEMPANFVQGFLSRKSESNRTLINQFLRYPDSSAGSLMTIEFMELKADWTAQEALEHIRRVGQDKETIYTCYITNDQKQLMGLVSLRRLILARPDLKLQEIAYEEEDIVSISVMDEADKAITLCQKYDLVTLPVVDSEKRLVGIITIDDVMDLLQEEVSEDFERMAGINPLEATYFETSTWEMLGKRLPWLLILLMSSFFSAGIIGAHEAMLASVTVLANYIPLLMNTAGNAGSQSTALIIRGLALETVRMKDIWRVIGREVLLASMIGLVMGGINFLRLYYLDGSLSSHAFRLEISISVSIALFCGIVLAKFLGGLLPIFLKFIKLDPAFMAGSVISTLLDILMITIYFKIIVFFLPL